MGYPTKTGPRLQPRDSAQSEKLDALTGALGANAGKEAVTKEQFASLGTTAIRSRYASAAPTQAEYNALVDDVRALASLLNKLGAQFTGM